MPRVTSPTTLAALEASVLRVEYLFEAEFSSDTLYLWSGAGDLSYDSKTWLGNGWFLGVNSMREVSKVQAEGLTVELSGVEPLVLSLALGATERQYYGRVWIVFLDASGAIIEASPRYIGRLDRVEITDDPGGSSTVKLSYESEMIRLRIPRERRYTHQDQIAQFSGDRGFEYVDSLADQRLYWGQPDTTRGG